MGSKMLVRKTYWVEYAHRLPDHPGFCKYLHGHSGKVEVVFEGTVDEKTGMVFDFGKFEWLKKIVEELDHSLVLQGGDPVLVWLLEGIDQAKIEPTRIVELSCPPTAENISIHLKSEIEEYISKNKGTGESLGPWFRLHSISFEETRKNEVTWRSE